ncbi:hypothetical protein [Chitinophaga silvisoli]|uniref:Uncharacterized protein n=1 Tax=Chitinophaga silvisoli TaxID=2291814 RepID=A0A3E1NSN4_9BACT|nr:hypothetical protein [Chitinophaga silvisoli]RFM30946.1 hypothetical protein DXN04_31965 [Chitinophaga silvisoli]
MGKKNQSKYCYMCGAPATSKEHVSPACLFPEKKDIKTSIFRNNLITVPSCELHNSKKSKDDEFLMACMSGIVGGNIIGFFHAHTKVRRAMERSGKDFVNVFMRDYRPAIIKSGQGKEFPVLVGRAHFDRLHSCFQHIAHGLYFHKFGKQFEGECRILLDFLTYENEKMETYKMLCRKRIELEPKKPKKEGLNPEIFRYEFMDPDEQGIIALIMTFYEGAKVFVAFQGKDCKPYFNLAGMLIESGVKMVINFPDGSHFEFN